MTAVKPDGWLIAANPLEFTALKSDDDIGRGGRWAGGTGEGCNGGGSVELIDVLRATEACIAGEPVGTVGGAD